MECLFCKIANGKTDTKIVYQDENFVAFYDINPKAPFHLLIVPKKHIESLINAKSKEDAKIINKALLVAAKIAKKFGVDKGYRLQINQGKKAGQEIDHLHIHLLGFLK